MGCTQSTAHIAERDGIHAAATRMARTFLQDNCTVRADAFVNIDVLVHAFAAYLCVHMSPGEWSRVRKHITTSQAARLLQQVAPTPLHFHGSQARSSDVPGFTNVMWNITIASGVSLQHWPTPMTLYG